MRLENLIAATKQSLKDHPNTKHAWFLKHGYFEVTTDHGKNKVFRP